MTAKRKVTTAEGLAVLAAGGSLAAALREDAAVLARLAEVERAEQQAREDAEERRRLDLAERKLRVNDRVRRLQRRRGSS